MGRRRKDSEATNAMFSVRLNEEHFKQIQALTHDAMKILNANWTGPTVEEAHIYKGDVIGTAMIIGLKRIISKKSIDGLV
jgi:hypothetical protein